MDLSLNMDIDVNTECALTRSPQVQESEDIYLCIYNHGSEFEHEYRCENVYGYRAGYGFEWG